MVHFTVHGKEKYSNRGKHNWAQNVGQDWAVTDKQYNGHRYRDNDKERSNDFSHHFLNLHEAFSESR